jgi:twitching motility protein PilT
METSSSNLAHFPASDFRESVPKLTELLKLLVDSGGSDLHLVPHTPPRLRIHGALKPLKDSPDLTPADTKNLVYSILTEAQTARFESKHEVDLAFAIKGLSRFRVNAFDHRSGVGATFRAIPFETVPLEKLNIPKPVIDLCDRPYGLILVTGPTGSGKSTTLASMIDKINRERDVNIITIEDPIEFIHTHKRAQVIQREVETNTGSFASATRAAFREDPDIVLIGELRDLETIEEALRIAETGHLTLATLHTNSAPSTVTRIIDVFPANQQPQIRTQLSNVLIGVIAQQLVPTANGKGRVMALESMLPNPAIRNLIRENKINQISSSMSSGQDEHGMVTMNQSLAKLIKEGVVTFEDAARRSNNVDELREKHSHISSVRHNTIRPVPSANSERRLATT